MTEGKQLDPGLSRFNVPRKEQLPTKSHASQVYAPAYYPSAFPLYLNIDSLSLSQGEYTGLFYLVEMGQTAQVCNILGITSLKEEVVRMCPAGPKV